MKAAIRQGSLFWRPDFGFSDDFPKPKLMEHNHVLLKVLAAAINPVDYKLPRPIGGKVYGIDVCGQVIEVGSGVTNWKVGDLVFGRSTSGSVAEYCLAGANEIARVPESYLTPVQAAALPVAYLTAVTGWNRVGLVDILENSSAASTTAAKIPECMVILGASGGCGLAASQLARGWGVKRIVGVCSAKNASYVKEMGGITEVLDYNDQTAMKEFADVNAGKIDHVYDTASFSGQGEDYNEWSLKLLKKDTGSYVALNGSVGTFLRFLILGGTGFRDRRQTLHITTFSTEGLELVIELLRKSTLKPDVHVMEFSKEGCQSGLEKLRSRRTKGKIVFDVVESRA